MSQSVDRAVAILQACASGPCRLADLAADLGVHRSTVLRLVQTLERHHLVRRLDDCTWAAGVGLIGMAMDSLDRMDVRTAAHPRLERMAREVGHTVHLAEVIGSGIVYTDKVERDSAVRMSSRIGTTASVHTAAVAKAILAGLSPGHRARVLDTATYQRFTDTTITSREGFAAELAQVRKQGYAVDNGERESYLTCIAVAVRDHTSAVSAGVSITALSAIEPLNRLCRHLPLLWTVASQISQDLGWDGTTGIDPARRPIPIQVSSRCPADDRDQQQSRRSRRSPDVQTDIA